MMYGDTGRCREIWGDVWRYGDVWEVWGDALGRGEVWEMWMMY